MVYIKLHYALQKDYIRKAHGTSAFFISETSNNKGFVFIAMLNYQRVSF
jgi:hypothetical protein